MILPDPWARKCSPAARASVVGANTLMSKTSCQTSSSSSTNGPAGAIPALLTMTSIRPSRSTTRDGSAATADRSRMSHAATSIGPGSPRASSASRSRCSIERPTPSTLTPSEASARAAARPSPRLAPVTIATRPASARSIRGPRRAPRARQRERGRCRASTLGRRPRRRASGAPDGRAARSSTHVRAPSAPLPARPGR